MPGVAQVGTSKRAEMEAERKEKKRLDVAVAAVREVVHTASNNDIVLALHNFDMDVEKTIQAFCEDGAQSALDSWNQGGASKKGKKGKGKPAPTIDAVNGRTEHMANGALPPHSNGNGHDPRFYESVSPTSSLPQRAPKAARPSNLANGHHTSAQAPYSARPSQAPYSARPSNAPSSARPSQAPSSARPAHPISMAEATAKKKTVEKETKLLDKHDAVIQRVHIRFNEEVDKGDDRITRAFNDMHTLLQQREVHLKAELQRCKHEGAAVLEQRSAKAQELHVRSERAAAMNDREMNDLRNEVKQFVNERKYEEELGNTIRFQWEPDTLVALIKNFGEVMPVKPIAGAKHCSLSSLVSSVGEDSGLGMTSPVSPGEAGKPCAAVTGGGMQMQSENLTEAQLEDINRRLQESLRSQGITADILSGVSGMSCASSSNAVMPPRPRPPRGGYRGGGRGRGRGAGRGRGGQHSNAPPQQPPIPNLTIFQD